VYYLYVTVKQLNTIKKMKRSIKQLAYLRLRAHGLSLFTIAAVFKCASQCASLKPNDCKAFEWSVNVACACYHLPAVFANV
jgi:hypothetical protein